MNDTEILNQLHAMLRQSRDTRSPVSPARLDAWVSLIEQERGNRREAPRDFSTKEMTVKVTENKHKGDWRWNGRDGGVEVWTGREWVDDNVVFHVEQKTPSGYIPAATPASPTHAPDDTNPPYTWFWRCNHHPIAITNWAEELDECDQGCCEVPRWFDNGRTT